MFLHQLLLPCYQFSSTLTHYNLAVFKSFTSVHAEDPFQDSVLAALPGPGRFLQNLMLMFVFQHPYQVSLAVFKSFTSVQLDPSQDSVQMLVVGSPPPKAKAEACIISIHAAASPNALAVFKLLQLQSMLDPFQDSVISFCDTSYPGAPPPVC